jgi:hypothetical protein
MKYPHKKDLFKFLKKENSFEEFLDNFSKISNFNSEHPVNSFVYVIKQVIFKNSKEILSEKIDGRSLCSALNIKLDETFNSMKSASETAQRLGEKDRYEISDLKEGLGFSKRLVNEVCYAYSED